MTDTPLVRTDSPKPAPRRPNGAIVAVAGLLLIAAMGIAVWWFMFGRESTPDWTRFAEIELAAPAGDAFLAETPWVRLRLAPLSPGAENTIAVSLEAPRGTPVPGDESPRIAAVTVQPLPAGPDAAEPLSLSAGVGGGLSASSRFDRPGWWHIGVDVESEGATAAADFYVLLPDPNINGPAAVPRANATAEGEALYQRGLAAIVNLLSVRYTQLMADGLGNAAISEHAVRAAIGDQPAGFTYHAAGGMEAVVIGSTRWIRFPGNPEWQKQEGAIVIPPSEWGEEYLGAAGFTILGEETVDGERCQLLAFVVPELTEPRSQSMAQYLWWVGTETGHVRREAMVSRQHYMRNHFTNFDAPLELTPPPMEATSAAGTPVS